MIETLNMFGDNYQHCSWKSGRFILLKPVSYRLYSLPRSRFGIYQRAFSNHKSPWHPRQKYLRILPEIRSILGPILGKSDAMLLRPHYVCEPRRPMKGRYLWRGRQNRLRPVQILNAERAEYRFPLAERLRLQIIQNHHAGILLKGLPSPNTPLCGAALQ